MKKALKWLGSIILVIVFILGLWTYMNWGHVKHFPSIISSFYAKTMCSCLYVEGHNEKYCQNYAHQYIPIQKITILANKKIVEIKGLWRINQAKYMGKRFGCMLQTHPLQNIGSKK